VEELVKVDNKKINNNMQEEKIDEKEGDYEEKNDFKIIEVKINELLETIKSENGLKLVNIIKNVVHEFIA
jgi:hypothetical protein